MQIHTNTRSEGPSTKEYDILSFPKDFFQDLLLRAQNPDGGWGHRPESQSTVEPTVWSILALRAHEATGHKVLTSALEWLRRTQLPSGAWPTSSGKEPGCWTTALACLAILKATAPSDDAVTRALNWLCVTWPAEGTFLWRLRNSWRRKSQSALRQNYSLRGWSWTPDTASWVEPTAYALILLRNVPAQYLPPDATERMQLAEKMLYDRACPGGGWNAGNPLVYGVPGVPRVGSTVWALLALKHNGKDETNRKALEWLEQNDDHISSPGALALSHLCLKIYGRAAAPIEQTLHEFYRHNRFLQSIQVMAWASLALGGIPDWSETLSQTEGN